MKVQSVHVMSVWNIEPQFTDNFTPFSSVLHNMLHGLLAFNVGLF